MAITISALNIHPLKGGAIRSLAEARIGPYGLLGDRLFMVVDKEGLLVSQRDSGKERLALIESELTEYELRLGAPSMPELVLARDSSGAEKRQVSVHGNILDALDCGPAASAWLTDFLGEIRGGPVGLVQFDTRSVRRLSAGWYPPNTPGTAFADGSPILVTSEESLAELNRRIIENGAAPIAMSRFRPNLVLAGLSEPFAEDRIKRLSLNSGEIEIALIKPCERCNVTTIDQTSGTKGADKTEPLRTLAQFRRGQTIMTDFPALSADKHNKVFFGIGAIAIRGEGKIIRVGDVVGLH